MSLDKKREEVGKDREEKGERRNVLASEDALTFHRRSGCAAAELVPNPSWRCVLTGYFIHAAGFSVFVFQLREFRCEVNIYETHSKTESLDRPEDGLQ